MIYDYANRYAHRSVKMNVTLNYENLGNINYYSSTVGSWWTTSRPF